MTYTVCERDGTVITITSELDLAMREAPLRGRYITEQDAHGYVNLVSEGKGDYWS